MLHLQEKAHHSLDDFRKGKGSLFSRHNSASESSTPVDDNDELSVLGGKTRLVAKKEPSSPPILNSSPQSIHPVVPLPLSPTTDNHLHPSVLEYLQTFAPQPQQQQATRHQKQSSSSSLSSVPYSDVDHSVALYGLSSVTSPFQSEPSFLPPSQSQSLSHSQSQSQPMYHHQNQHQHQGQASSPTHQRALHQQPPSNTSFPQYFPVYDYTAVENGYTTPTMAEENAALTQHRSSGTPEANMQTTWQDFVANFAHMN